ncbi:3-beta hydroxysteroid dehydrogenase [Candidatus Uabimicrobium amorphum]|uniref:3-beta hydroxysteroid dehydrogenase n=1 Tax=Uabimicrobium amorphum TaxID=2596890 RepID=A0A5S9IUC1_UABAM|nr:NAD-dependent epimerase/dehydratase family protein [Candidatus Uabimicrobium amorphum]BBM86775.1 3-beta hydroxysteroid dehydrogenase [Candidatus Uabimicrobium amorphum]
MQIFITGASGFVGKATTKSLAKNHKVMAMARSEQSAQVVSEAGAHPVKCALGSVKAQDLQDCEVVIHCAAFVEEWGSEEQFWQANVVGTQQLLDVAKQAGVKRFIHISTEAVLFHGQHLRNIDENYPYPQKTPILYSRTKAAAEKAVVMANDAHFTTICLRPRLIWGPGDKTIVPAIRDMVATGKFKWIGGGHYQTSTVYIDNLVHAITLALTKGTGGEKYFITDNEDQDMRQFLTQMLQTQGVNLPKKSVPRFVARSAARIIEFLWRILAIKKQPPITRHAAYVMSIAL